MPFWSSQTLKARISADHLVEPYDASRVVHCAYEMGVGAEAFVTSNPSDKTQVPAGTKIVIPPGQFGLLVTRETVYVPAGTIAFISIRAGIKFQGLVNVSGFHVDPGYRGQLKFAVYNAGSRTIVLDQDQRVFMIWFADLDHTDENPYEERQPPQTVITADDVMKIQGEVASPAELKKQIDELKTDFEKKIHAVEQAKLFNRTLILMLVAAFLTLIVTVFIKPYFEGGKAGAQTPAAVQSADKQLPAAAATPGETAKVIALPAHLGFYILGSGAIAGACVIIAGLLVRKMK
jgi:dCTP deaminase